MLQCPVHKCLDQRVCDTAPRRVSEVIGRGFDALIEGHALLNADQQPIKLAVVLADVAAHGFFRDCRYCKHASVNIVEWELRPIAFGMRPFAQHDHLVNIDVRRFSNQDTSLFTGMVGGVVVGGVAVGGGLAGGVGGVGGGGGGGLPPYEYDGGGGNVNARIGLPV